MKAAAAAIELLRHAAALGWRAHAVHSFVCGALKLLRIRRGVVLDNLRRAYPEKSDAWRLSVMNGMYDNLSWIIVEQLVLQRDPMQALKWMEEIEGEENIIPCLENKKGVIQLTAHFNNWELFLAWGQLHGYNQGVIVRGPSDKDVDALLARYRSISGVRIFDRQKKEDAVIKLVRFLRDGGFLAIAADINWNDGVKAPFFGSECKTTPGPVVLSLLSGAPIVPYFSYRIGPFRHKVKIGKPLKIPEEGSRSDKINKVTHDINNCIESYIREQPDLWFWMHKRWKQ